MNVTNDLQVEFAKFAVLVAGSEQTSQNNFQRDILSVLSSSHTQVKHLFVVH